MKCICRRPRSGCFACSGQWLFGASQSCFRHHRGATEWANDEWTSWTRTAEVQMHRCKRARLVGRVACHRTVGAKMLNSLSRALWQRLRRSGATLRNSAFNGVAQDRVAWTRFSPTARSCSRGPNTVPGPCGGCTTGSQRRGSPTMSVGHAFAIALFFSMMLMHGLAVACHLFT